MSMIEWLVPTALKDLRVIQKQGKKQDGWYRTAEDEVRFRGKTRVAEAGGQISLNAQTDVEAVNYT